ncbi:unnamed protein product [Gadus morhua 'NCC']
MPPGLGLIYVRGPLSLGWGSGFTQAVGFGFRQIIRTPPGGWQPLRSAAPSQAFRNTGPRPHLQVLSPRVSRERGDSY